MNASFAFTPTQPLTFGAVVAQHQLTLQQQFDLWQMTEDAGFDSIWLFDHFKALFGDPNGPCLETSVLYGAMALKTTRAKLGVLVYGNTHRHPSVFAKEIATVDHLSNGRVILGIGAAWNEPEHANFAIPFPSAGDRVGMLDESVQIIKSAFTDEKTDFHGQYYDLTDAPFFPKPVQAHVPIMIGGKKPRMMKLIAKHADIWDGGKTPEMVLAGNAMLADNCAAIGRDHTEIIRSASLGDDKMSDEANFSELVRAYRRAGVSQILFDFPRGGAAQEAALRIAATQIPALRQEFNG